MRKLLGLLWGVFSTQLYAFPCFVTLVKNTCWTDYNVTINVTNADTTAPILSATIPQGQSWVRKKFDCQPREALSFSATFTPVIWQNEAKKIYPGGHNWFLPEAVMKDVTAWNLTICFPKEFSEVPLPPTALNNCECKTDDIPPIKPQ